jgi:hypothetical protein
MPRRPAAVSSPRVPPRTPLLVAAVAVAAALAAAACGSSSPAADGRRFVLAGGNIAGTNAGFDVNAGRVVADGENDPDADFYLSLTMIVSLFPATPEGGLCARGTGLARVEDVDVPADLASCTFTLVDLGGNAPHAESRHAGEGYVVKDRQGALGGRLLIVSDRLLDDGTAEVAFDFLR